MSLKKDYFTRKDDLLYAGTHLIVDLWDANNLSDIEVFERAMRDSVRESGATLLHIHLHPFGENQGVTGVAVLAESHITIHSWPEINYCALDVFMCGDSHPEKTIEIFKTALQTNNVQITEHKRGIINESE